MSAERKSRRFDDDGPLGAPLAERLTPPIDEERVAAVWQQIRQAQAERVRMRRSPWRLMLALPAVAAAAALAMWLWTRDAAPEVVVAGTAAEAVQGGMLLAHDPAVEMTPGAELLARPAVRGEELVMRDGSRLRLDQGARLQVLENDAERFVAMLEQGPARFEVQEGQRRWTIETKLASIEVIASVFTVAHEHHQVRIAVERGVLMVRGERVPGRVVRLAAGGELVVKDSTIEEAAKGATSAAELATAAAVKSEQPGSAGMELPEVRAPQPAPITAPMKQLRREPAAPREPRPPRTSHQPQDPPAKPATPAVSTSSTSLDGAERRPSGANDGGDALLRRKPGSAGQGAVTPLPASVAETLREAATLRQQGEAASAAELLARALAAYPGDPAAGMMEFTLGRLYLERLDEPGRAADTFAAVIARGSPQSLVEDAAGRRCEALWKAGRKAAARAAFAEYLQAYPKGARRAALETLFGSP